MNRHVDELKRIIHDLLWPGLYENTDGILYFRKANKYWINDHCAESGRGATVHNTHYIKTSHKNNTVSQCWHNIGLRHSAGSG